MRDKLRLQRREAEEGAVVALGAGTNDDGNNGKPGNICAPMQRPATPQSLPGFQAPVRNPTRTSLLPTSGAGCGGNSKGPCRPGRGRGEGRRHGFSPWGMGNCFAFPLWMKGAGWGWWLRDFCRNTAARAFSTGWQHPHWCCCKEPGRQEVKYALTWGSETARPLLLTEQQFKSRKSCIHSLSYPASFHGQISVYSCTSLKQSYKVRSTALSEADTKAVPDREQAVCQENVQWKPKHQSLSLSLHPDPVLPSLQQEQEGCNIWSKGPPKIGTRAFTVGVQLSLSG